MTQVTQERLKARHSDARMHKINSKHTIHFLFQWHVIEIHRLRLSCAPKSLPMSTAKTWGFPSQFIQINRGVTGHTTRASPGVPRTRAGLESGTSRFSTRRINHYATRGGTLTPQWIQNDTKIRNFLLQMFEQEHELELRKKTGPTGGLRRPAMLVHTEYWMAPITIEKILLDNSPRAPSLGFRRLCFCSIPPL